mgnify:CR=1 FL=1
MATEHENFQLKFQEQIDFLKQKVRLPTLTYRDISSRGHDRAFVVAGAMKADLLNDLHNAVNKAVAEGQSFKQFQDGFDDVLGKHGWLNGTDKEYRAWRAKVIYQTNMRTSHAAGRYKQMTDPEVLKRRPYWVYRHNTVENPRIQHEKWNGLVLPADSQFWRVNFPPNGYGCKCDVYAINERQLNAMGKTKPDDEPAFDSVRDGFDSAAGASWYPDLNKYPEQIATDYVSENMRDGIFDRWLLRIAAQVEEEIAKPEYKDLPKEKVIKKLRTLDIGTVLSKDANGIYQPIDFAATDGTEDAVAVLATHADINTSQQKIVLIARGATVAKNELVFPEGATEPQIAAALAQLEALGIVAQDTY